MHSFVLLVVGDLPQEAIPETAEQLLLPLFSHSILIGPHIRSSGLVVSSMPPLELIKHLGDHVPPPVSLVTP